MKRQALLLWLGLLALLPACASVGPREPVRFGTASRPAGAEGFPNWTAPPTEAMRAMAGDEAHLESVKHTDAGTSGAREIMVSLGDTSGKLKAKKVPDDLDGINNSPRKELAAYAIQRFFLDPEDYVVPATVLRCIPIDVFRADQGSDVPPNVAGTRCRLLVLSMWFQDVRLLEGNLLDRERFLTEPGYAYYMSNLNLFTYLIEHQDGRDGNFLVSDDGRRQVFAIDNGVSFGQPWPFYNWFVMNWNVLRVPAVRSDPVERLRPLTREDLDSLLVVAQLEPDADGVLKLVPPGPPHDPHRGATRRGDVLQFGLTEAEVDAIWTRIQDLVASVDAGELPVF